jgi:hypothetical protein
MLRIPHGLDSRLTDGGKFASSTNRTRSTSQKLYCSYSGSHFCSRLGEPQGLVRPEGLVKLKKIHSPPQLEAYNIITLEVYPINV